MTPRNDRYLSVIGLPDNEPNHVYFEQERGPTTCEHSVEFWVAVRCLDDSTAPVVMQWCMICQSFEALSIDAYEARHALRREDCPSVIPDWWEKEQIR